jgi:regulator of nucleoside diphosphate kinase
MTIMEGRPAIVLTCSDRDRLSSFIMAPGAASATSEFLRQELERAEIVPEQLAETLVAIGTHVRFIDHSSHKVSEGRLTFPNDIETSDAIPVLSPLGSALLGLSPGQTIGWKDESGQDRKLTVVEIHPPTARHRSDAAGGQSLPNGLSDAAAIDRQATAPRP